MTERRPTIGFPTPSKEIEDSFDRISQELDAQKTTWGSWLEKSLELEVLAKALGDSLRTSMTVDRSDHRVTMFMVAIAFKSVVNNMKLLSKLGEDIAETHKRLSRVEKAIKDLGLKLPK